MQEAMQGTAPHPGAGRRGVRALLVAALAVAMFVAGGLGLWNRVHPQAPAVAPRTAPALQDRPVIASGTLSRTIATLQARLEVLPRDWQSWATLGLAYVQQARITADPTYYPKAEGVLRRSLSLHPAANFQALTGLGALALARHDFSGALRWGRRAEAANPDNANVRGVVGDALVELGRYPEAYAAFQRMVDLRPDLSSYARAAYAHELQGDPRGAAAIMNLALEAAATPADRAWTYNQLGDLAFNGGDPAGAERSYRAARQIDPSFVPAMAGLAKVLAARGDLAAAARLYRAVVRRYPLPDYVIALGDVQAAAGDTGGARRSRDLLRFEERLFRANGVNVDLEVALFDADHRVDLAGGLEAARAEWGRRRSVQVADAYAWSLYANGRYREALRYADQALRTGMLSAPFLFHRGMIERALGLTGRARRDLRAALEVNPGFSVLWSKVASRTLAGLEGRA
jgi:tetratricopeptide (TPR) repeat protein